MTRGLEIAPWSAVHFALWARPFRPGSTQCSPCSEDSVNTRQAPLDADIWMEEEAAHLADTMKHTVASRSSTPLYPTLESIQFHKLCIYFITSFSQKHCEIDKVLLLSQTGKLRLRRLNWFARYPQFVNKVQLRDWLAPGSNRWLQPPFSFIPFVLSTFLSSYICCVNLIKHQVMVQRA